jgi:hypothetical protein
MDYPFRRQDIYAATLLIAFSLFIIVDSWRMPREMLGFPAYAGPGVVTGLLGLGLLVMALTLLVRALRRPGKRVGIPRAEVQAYFAAPETRRLGLVLLLNSAYLLSLGHGIPYYITTGGYLVATMAVFRAASWWMIALVAGLATTALAVVFNQIFLVPLP